MDTNTATQTVPTNVTKATVTWSQNAGGPIRTTVINLTHTRAKGMDDHEAARRIIAIAVLNGLADADTMTIHALVL